MIDARTLEPGSVLECDLCIVGGGVAGLTLATSLLGRGLRILVMESGPAEGVDDETESLRDGENAGLPYFAIRDLTHRGLGGNSTRWSSFVCPFDEIDFEVRDWVSGSGWPIRRADLQPFYEKASETCGVGEYVYDAEAMGRRVDKPGFSPLEDGQGLCATRMFQFRLPPLDWWEAYGSRIAADDAIDIMTFANAVSIELDENNRQVDRISFATVNGKRFDVRAGRFVLAMGGIEIPRVMLASGRDRRFAVGNEHGLVGRYFMEHPHYTGHVTVVRSGEGPEFPLMYTWNAINEHDMVGMIGPTSDVQREERILNCVTMLQKRREPFAGAAAADGFGDHLVEVFKDSVSFVDRAVRSRRLGGRIGLEPHRSRFLEFRIQFEQAPDPESRVTLSDELDPLGLPRVQLHWRLNDLDRRSFRVGQEVIARELSRLGLGRARFDGMEEDDPWPPPFKAGSVPSLFGAWHHMGTTRMSDDPKRGVVDADCRVHGVANLYIAGPSVFPTGSFANPVMTFVALTHRLADHLLGEPD